MHVCVCVCVTVSVCVTVYTCMYVCMSSSYALQCLCTSKQIGHRGNAPNHMHCNACVPVNKLATEVDVPNCVSMYLGRKTTKPDTIAISQLMAGSSRAYTGFLSSFRIDLGISATHITYFILTVLPRTKSFFHLNTHFKKNKKIKTPDNFIYYSN